jgi:hypothetical protein
MPFDPTDPDTKAALAAAVEDATAGLKTKVDELIGSEKKLKPEDMAALESENEGLRAKLSAAEKTAKEAATAAEKATKALETETGFTRKLLVENNLKDTLLKGGVKDEDFLDALVTKFSQGAAVVADGDARKAMLGDKELSAVVGEYLASDAGKKFVAAPVNGGGGAQGGGGESHSKTVSRDKFNAMSHPERAAFAKDGGKVIDQAA